VGQAVKRAGDARMDGLGSRAGEVPVTGRAGCRGYGIILTLVGIASSSHVKL
jgi:hypothetical protein